MQDEKIYIHNEYNTQLIKMFKINETQERTDCIKKIIRKEVFQYGRFLLEKNNYLHEKSICVKI